jgi:vancomycin resistance protein YoaR
MTNDRAARHVSGPQVLLAVVAGLICAAASIPALMPHPVTEAAEAATIVLTAPSRGAPAAVGPTPSIRPISGPMGFTDSEPDPDLVLLGSSTIVYEVGRENGQGANIEIPLRHLDGLVIQPGATFDFWGAVGEVSRRTGYRQGGLIVGDHIEETGALAGGICTVSTALFDAAARAGLRIVSRTSHSGYLAKYPLGLDAAVAKSDRSRQTLAFRNDTAEPIVIRTVSSPGIARVDLYGAAALGRQVTFSEPVISHKRRAHDRHVGTRSLPSGQHRRIEPSSDGMTVVVTRTVRDASGRVVHHDRWMSVYRPLDGLVLDGTS